MAQNAARVSLIRCGVAECGTPRTTFSAVDQTRTTRCSAITGPVAAPAMRMTTTQSLLEQASTSTSAMMRASLDEYHLKQGLWIMLYIVDVISRPQYSGARLPSYAYHIIDYRPSTVGHFMQLDVGPGLACPSPIVSHPSPVDPFPS